MTSRTAKLERKTRETEVSVKLDIDGKGRFSVKSDIRFLNHMVETFARYASFDVELSASGDDEHHVVEDVAITLGAAFREALGGIPVERTASATMPMDDALVTVSVDIIDRPFADIDCPDPLYQHFLRSFAMSAGLTLHVLKTRGFDEHHIVEASFKGLGKALRGAVVPREAELSTKDKAKVG
ncbi:MAG: imidazoleglycerol-phosphate dehydratase [Candidatus Methanoplasma sp.]|jgi:imidazoleglycerol-phosphate dehydratase|nr:imidazoleglycerol-phosphate dehydratase [Candidatus Methanoplasma sp.]